MKRLLAELIGTFALVLAGTGAAIVVNDASNGAVTHVGISAAFGRLWVYLTAPALGALLAVSLCGGSLDRKRSGM